MKSTSTRKYNFSEEQIEELIKGINREPKHPRKTPKIIGYENSKDTGIVYSREVNNSVTNLKQMQKGKSKQKKEAYKEAELSSCRHLSTKNSGKIDPTKINQATQHIDDYLTRQLLQQEKNKRKTPILIHPMKRTTLLITKKGTFLYNMYGKYKEKFSDYLERNKEGLKLFGTTKYINRTADYYLKEHLNENEFHEERKIDALTPLPAKSRKKMRNKNEKNEFYESERTAVAMRRYEYIQSFESREKLKQEYRLREYYNKNAIIIQNWWRFILYIRYQTYHCIIIQKWVRGYLSRLKFFRYYNFSYLLDELERIILIRQVYYAFMLIKNCEILLVEEIEEETDTEEIKMINKEELNNLTGAKCVKKVYDNLDDVNQKIIMIQRFIRLIIYSEDELEEILLKNKEATFGCRYISKKRKRNNNKILRKIANKKNNNTNITKVIYQINEITQQIIFIQQQWRNFLYRYPQDEIIIKKEKIPSYLNKIIITRLTSSNIPQNILTKAYASDFDKRQCSKDSIKNKPYEIYNIKYIQDEWRKMQTKPQKQEEVALYINKEGINSGNCISKVRLNLISKEVSKVMTPVRSKSNIMYKKHVENCNNPLQKVTLIQKTFKDHLKDTKDKEKPIKYRDLPSKESEDVYGTVFYCTKNRLHNVQSQVNNIPLSCEKNVSEIEVKGKPLTKKNLVKENNLNNLQIITRHNQKPKMKYSMSNVNNIKVESTPSIKQKPIQFLADKSILSKKHINCEPNSQIKTIQTSWRKRSNSKNKTEETPISKPNPQIYSSKFLSTKQRINLEPFERVVLINKDKTNNFVSKNIIQDKDGTTNKVKTIQRNWRNKTPQKEEIPEIEIPHQITTRQIPETRELLSKLPIKNKENDIDKVKTIQRNYRAHNKVSTDDELTQQINKQHIDSYISKLRKKTKNEVEFIHREYLNEPIEKEALVIPKGRNNVNSFVDKNSICNFEDDLNKIKIIQNTFKQYLYLPTNDIEPVKINKDIIESVPSFVDKKRIRLQYKKQEPLINEIIVTSHVVKPESSLITKDSVVSCFNKIKTIQKEYKNHLKQIKDKSDLITKPNKELIRGNSATKTRHKRNPIQSQNPILLQEDESQSLTENKIISPKLCPINASCFITKSNSKQIPLEQIIFIQQQFRNTKNNEETKIEPLKMPIKFQSDLGKIRRKDLKIYQKPILSAQDISVKNHIVSKDNDINKVKCLQKNYRNHLEKNNKNIILSPIKKDISANKNSSIITKNRKNNVLTCNNIKPINKENVITKKTIHNNENNINSIQKIWKTKRTENAIIKRNEFGGEVNISRGNSATKNRKRVSQVQKEELVHCKPIIINDNNTVISKKRIFDKDLIPKVRTIQKEYRRHSSRSQDKKKAQEILKPTLNEEYVSKERKIDKMFMLSKPDQNNKEKGRYISKYSTILNKPENEKKIKLIQQAFKNKKDDFNENEFLSLKTIPKCNNYISKEYKHTIPINNIRSIQKLYKNKQTEQDDNILQNIQKNECYVDINRIKDNYDDIILIQRNWKNKHNQPKILQTDELQRIIPSECYVTKKNKKAFETPTVKVRPINVPEIINKQTIINKEIEIANIEFIQQEVKKHQNEQTYGNSPYQNIEPISLPEKNAVLFYADKKVLLNQEPQIKLIQNEYMNYSKRKQEPIIKNELEQCYISLERKEDINEHIENITKIQQKITSRQRNKRVREEYESQDEYDQRPDNLEQGAFAEKIIKKNIDHEIKAIQNEYKSHLSNKNKYLDYILPKQISSLGYISKIRKDKPLLNPIYVNKYQLNLQPSSMTKQRKRSVPEPFRKTPNENNSYVSKESKINNNKEIKCIQKEYRDHLQRSRSKPQITEVLSVSRRDILPSKISKERINLKINKPTFENCDIQTDVISNEEIPVFLNINKENSCYYSKSSKTNDLNKVKFIQDKYRNHSLKSKDKNNEVIFIPKDIAIPSIINKNRINLYYKKPCFENKNEQTEEPCMIKQPFNQHCYVDKKIIHNELPEVNLIQEKWSFHSKNKAQLNNKDMLIIVKPNINEKEGLGFYLTKQRKQIQMYKQPNEKIIIENPCIITKNIINNKNEDTSKLQYLQVKLKNNPKVSYLDIEQPIFIPNNKAVSNLITKIYKTPFTSLSKINTKNLPRCLYTKERRIIEEPIIKNKPISSASMFQKDAFTEYTILKKPPTESSNKISFFTKKTKIFISLPKNWDFLLLYKQRLIKNVQEFTYVKLFDRQTPDLLPPDSEETFYFNTLRRHLKITNDIPSQQEDIQTIETVKSHLKSNKVHFEQELPKNVVAFINEEPEKKVLMETELYSQSQTLPMAKYINYCYKKEKNINNCKVDMIENRLNRSALHNTNIFAITKFMDQLFKDAIKGRFCQECYCTSDEDCENCNCHNVKILTTEEQLEELQNDIYTFSDNEGEEESEHEGEDPSKKAQGKEIKIHFKVRKINEDKRILEESEEEIDVLKNIPNIKHKHENNLNDIISRVRASTKNRNTMGNYESQERIIKNDENENEDLVNNFESITINSKRNTVAGLGYIRNEISRKNKTQGSNLIKLREYNPNYNNLD